MKKWVLFLMCSFSACALFITQTVQEIDSFDQVQDTLSKADASTLIVLEINDTLLTYQDQQLRKKFRESEFIQQLEDKYEALIRQHKNAQSYERLLRGIILKTAKKRLIEPNAVEQIKQARDKGAKVILLTHTTVAPFGEGKHCVIPNVPEWRFAELLSFGIDLSSSFPESQIIFDQLPKYLGYHPVFYKGILFANTVLKGRMLGAFLDKVGWKPSMVIFFDANRDQVQDVAKEMKKRRISYRGYYYKGEAKLPGQLDEEIAAMQQYYLFKHEKWLDDGQAKKKIMQGRMKEHLLL